PRRRGADGSVAALALRALRRPLVAGLVVLALILALALPSLRLDMGPPSAYVMPKSQDTHHDFAAFESTLGNGWTSPYEVIVASRHGPITDRRTLAALSRFQQNLKRRSDVATVLGPGEIAQRTSKLDSVPD